MPVIPIPVNIDDKDSSEGIFSTENFLLNGGEPFTGLVCQDYRERFVSTDDDNHPFRESILEPMDLLTSAITGLTMNEADAVTSDDSKFEVQLEVYNFLPEEIKVKVVNGKVVVEGDHEEKPDYYGYVSRKFIKKYDLPKQCLPDTVESTMSADGILTITAPKVLPMPAPGIKIVPVRYSAVAHKLAQANDGIPGVDYDDYKPEK